MKTRRPRDRPAVSALLTAVRAHQHRAAHPQKGTVLEQESLSFLAVLLSYPVLPQGGGGLDEFWHGLHSQFGLNRPGFLFLIAEARPWTITI